MIINNPIRRLVMEIIAGFIINCMIMVSTVVVYEKVSNILQFNLRILVYKRLSVLLHSFHPVDHPGHVPHHRLRYHNGYRII